LVIYKQLKLGSFAFFALIRHRVIIPHDFSVSFFANVVTFGLLSLLLPMPECGGDDKIMLSSSKH
jgi:hypothetical protein